MELIMIYGNDYGIWNNYDNDIWNIYIDSDNLSDYRSYYLINIKKRNIG
jgi:hypothetical protein